LTYWISKDFARQLAAIARKASSEAEVTTRIREFSGQHPQILALLPAMLDRGDEAARRFAILLAKQLETPKAFAALRDYCTSDRGPDQSRSEVAYYLREKGQLPPGSLRMSVEGEWTEIEIFGFEVYEEPDEENLASPKVRPLLQRAAEMLYDDQPEQAESLLREAMESEPDQPSTLNNLASALEMQGRKDEAHELMQEIHRRWPDYFFGRIAMAGEAIMQQEYEQADAYLDPLRHRTRLHRTEYTALCRTYATLHLAQMKFESAQRWLDLWRQVDPDNPESFGRRT
jgi:Tfp pilus assembly protein PilF